MTPLALQLSAQVQRELECRHADADTIRKLEVQRASEAVDLARRRYMQVDPDRRMVADALEAEWNLALRALRDARDNYVQWQQAQSKAAVALTSAQLAELAGDFQSVWADSATASKDRKRMLGLLLADVMLLREPGGDISVHMRYKTGVTKSLVIERRLQLWQLHKTQAATLSALDDLLNDYTDAETAERLNAMGLVPAIRARFTRQIVQNLRKDNGLPSYAKRLETRGMLTVLQLAEAHGVCHATIRQWHRQGKLTAIRADDKGKWLFDPKVQNIPELKIKGSSQLANPEQLAQQEERGAV